MFPRACIGARRGFCNTPTTKKILLGTHVRTANCGSGIVDFISDQGYGVLLSSNKTHLVCPQADLQVIFEDEEERRLYEDLFLADIDHEADDESEENEEVDTKERDALVPATVYETFVRNLYKLKTGKQDALEEVKQNVDSMTKETQKQVHQILSSALYDYEQRTDDNDILEGYLQILNVQRLADALKLVQHFGSAPGAASARYSDISWTSLTLEYVAQGQPDHLNLVFPQTVSNVHSLDTAVRELVRQAEEGHN